MKTRLRLAMLASAVLALSIDAVTASAGEHVVSQKNKTFSTQKLKIKVGDTVTFRNDDPFFHNIFSLSEIQSFELGAFPRGQSRKATFNRPGVIEVECALHPGEKMFIQVDP